MLRSLALAPWARRFPRPRLTNCLDILEFLPQAPRKEGQSHWVSSHDSSVGPLAMQTGVEHWPQLGISTNEMRKYFDVSIVGLEFSFIAWDMDNFFHLKSNFSVFNPNVWSFFPLKIQSRFPTFEASKWNHASFSHWFTWSNIKSLGIWWIFHQIGGESQLRSWISKRMELMLSKGQALPQDLAIITRTATWWRGEATLGTET